MDHENQQKFDAERSSDDKLSDSHLEAPHPYVADLPPDPDAHLSAEERAAIVRPSVPQSLVTVVADTDYSPS